MPSREVRSHGSCPSSTLALWVSVWTRCAGDGVDPDGALGREVHEVDPPLAAPHGVGVRRLERARGDVRVGHDVDVVELARGLLRVEAGRGERELDGVASRRTAWWCSKARSRARRAAPGRGVRRDRAGAGGTTQPGRPRPPACIGVAPGVTPSTKMTRSPGSYIWFCGVGLRPRQGSRSACVRASCCRPRRGAGRPAARTPESGWCRRAHPRSGSRSRTGSGTYRVGETTAETVPGSTIGT